MRDNEHSAALHLLETGTLVGFRVLHEEVTPGPDEGDFSVRIDVQFHVEEDHDPAELAEWAAFGFVFTLGVLSFADARPRGYSEAEYNADAQFSVADFFRCLRYRRGELHFYADYVRGRRLKTDIVVRPDGVVTLSTFGRGKSALRWLDRLRGKNVLQPV
jgi:hypothetical protein